MSPVDDHQGGMWHTDLLDDDTIEAFFLREPDARWNRDRALVRLATDVEAATTGVPRVIDPTLADLMGEVAVGSPSLRVVGAARSVSTGVAESGRLQKDRPPRQRFRLWATVAASAAVAAASLAVAGTSGVVPEPAVRLVARAVEVLTPIELSDEYVPPGPPSPTPTILVPAAPLPEPQASVSPARITLGHPGPVTAPAPPEPPAPPAATGIDRARETPAGDFIPPFVTGPPTSDDGAGDGGGEAPPAATGTDRARQTPAGSIAPPFAGGPGERGVGGP